MYEWYTQLSRTTDPQVMPAVGALVRSTTGAGLLDYETAAPKENSMAIHQNAIHLAGSRMG